MMTPGKVGPGAGPMMIPGEVDPGTGSVVIPGEVDVPYLQTECMCEVGMRV